MKATLSINGNLVELEGTWPEFLELFSSISSAQARQPEAADAETGSPRKESYAKYYHDALQMSLRAFVAANSDKPADELLGNVLTACKAKQYDLDEQRVLTAIKYYLATKSV